MNQSSLRLYLNTDQTLIPRQVPSQRVLEITVQAPAAASQYRHPRLNLALVLDRSGSMSGDKLEYVKRAAAHVLDLLREQDWVALVAYDDEISLLSPSVPMTHINRNELKMRVASLRSGGSTNLCGGWLAGCQEVASAAQQGTLNRALLLTDGLANVGITGLEELATHARELSRRGVSTSTFGVGEGFNEHLLEAMSAQGGGNFYYIETPTEIPALFQREFQELAAVTTCEVEIILEIPAHVSLQVLGGWRTEFHDGRLHIFLGDLNAGKNQELYVRLLTPPAEVEGELTFTARVTAKGEAGHMLEDRAQVSLRYADQAAVVAEPQNRDVLERFAQVDIADTVTEALKLERKGELEKANRLLDQSIHANLPYLPPDQAEDYRRLSERMKRGMDEADRKATHFNSYNQRRRRER